ncbi:MAG TPA: C13 family peptidase [Steroidobacteraceae bacterium]
MNETPTNLETPTGLDMPGNPSAPPGRASPPRGWFSALTRLWLLRTLDAPPHGSALRAALLMAMLWLAAWVAIDRWQSQPDPKFFAGNIPLFAWYVLAVLGLSAVLRWRVRPAPGFAPMLALAVAAVPLPLLLSSVLGIFLEPAWLMGAALLMALYTLLFLRRGLQAVTGTEQRAAAFAGLIFFALFVWLSDALDVIPDVWAPAQSEAAQSAADVDGEAILFSQAKLIDESLAAVGRDVAPHPKAYFLGFAGVGDEKVFAQEIGLASRVLGERYGLAGRSLSLINDERDLERAPLASVSGLRYALQGLGSLMDREQDVLFLAISSHGSQDPSIAVENSQLPLNDLSDEDLADALRESGIRWRVIIISACYAGGFIEALRDPQTIVITAAAADRTSFGCSNDRDLTYFGEAFYRDALPEAESLREAFEAAKAAIDARERAEHITASKPEAYFGAKIEAKLAAMRHSSS